MKKLIAIILILLPLAGKAQTGDFETAAEAVSHMGVGWNLGNTLDSHTNYDGTDIRRMETAWSQFMTHEKVMRMMKEAGFKSIRVPVTWYRFMDEEGNVDPAWMARVHEVVDYVLNQEGMYCILNVHHDTGATKQAWLVADMDNYNRNKDRFEHLWRQIAEEFKDYGERLLFEGYNEMLDSCWSWGYASARRPAGYSEELARSAYDAINAYAQSFVTAVRSTGGNNLKRNLICSIYCASEGTAGNYNSHLQDPVKEMKMPTEPEGVAPGHQMVEMHYYRNLDNMTEAKARVDFLMDVLKEYIVDRLGVPVVIGEWGPRTSDNSEAYDTKRKALVEFCHYFIQKTQEYGYATLYWRGLSEKIARLWPAYNQPEVAEAILKAYYGDEYKPKLPLIDDYVYDYTEVTYMNQYSWIYLSKDRTLDINEYDGVRIELKEKPGRNTLQLRIHRTAGEKPEYNSANRTNLSENELVTTFLFSKDPQWGDVANIELHRISAGDDVVAKIGRCVLLRKNGTEEELTLTHRANAHFTDLMAYPKYELDETSTLPPTESANKVAAIVKRTIKANEWSTLCLPFNMTEEQVAAAFGEDAKLADFNGYQAEKNDADKVTGIKINFNTATTIQANRPCLIKVSKPVDEFTVKNVDVAPQESPAVELGTAEAPSSLVGTYAAETFVPDNCMFLSNNKFWYSVGLTKMKGYRAYFRLNDVLSDVADRQSGAKVFLFVDNEDETTAVNAIFEQAPGNAQREEWFAPDGRRLYAKPTARGLYIMNGKKVIIK